MERDQHWCSWLEFGCAFGWVFADKFLCGSLTSLVLLVCFVRTCDFLKYTEFLLMMTSSLQRLLQNQSPETILVCTVVLCFPHNNIACIHMCDEFKKSNVPRVCHKILSTLWTRKFVHRPQNIKSPNTRQIQTFQNNLWANCIHFSYWSYFFFFQIGGHQGMALRLCVIAQLFYWQVRSIFPRISLRDLPCQRTKKISFRHQVSQWLSFLATFL